MSTEIRVGDRCLHSHNGNCKIVALHNDRAAVIWELNNTLTSCLLTDLTKVKKKIKGRAQLAIWLLTGGEVRAITLCGPCVTANEQNSYVATNKRSNPRLVKVDFMWVEAEAEID